jgi:hypothetical protein
MSSECPTCEKKPRGQTIDPKKFKEEFEQYVKDREKKAKWYLV